MYTLADTVESGISPLLGTQAPETFSGAAMPTIAQLLQGLSPLSLASFPAIGSLLNQTPGQTYSQQALGSIGQLQNQSALPDYSSTIQSAVNPLLNQQDGLGMFGQSAGMGYSPFLSSSFEASPATQAAAQAFQKLQMPVIQNQMALAGLGNSPALGQEISLGMSSALVPFLQADLQNRLTASQGLSGLESLDQGSRQAAAQSRLGGTQALQAQQQFGQQGQIAALSGYQNQAQLEQQAQQAADQARLGGLNSLGQQQTISQQNQLGGLNALGQQGGLENQALQTAGQLRLGGAQALQGEEGLNQNAAQLSANIANQEAQRQLQAQQVAQQGLMGYSSNYAQPLGAMQSQGQQSALTGLAAGGELQQGQQQAMSDAQRQEFLRLQGLSEGGTTGLFGGSVLPPTFEGTTSTKGGK